MIERKRFILLSEVNQNYCCDIFIFVSEVIQEQKNKGTLCIYCTLSNYFNYNHFFRQAINIIIVVLT